jgi:hypothetical protein
MAVMDIEAIIDSVIKNDLDPSIFNKIDDRDFPEAPNVLEFCLNKDYLRVNPYPRQIEILITLFEEWCPDCTDPKLMSDGLHRQPLPEILDRLQMLEYGKCPKCHKTKLDFYKSNQFTFPYELDAAIGQRSGKSAVTAMASNYVYHRFVKLGSPSHYFGLMPGSTLHGTFTAITHEQAEETLFQPFLDMHESSPWWKKYYGMLDHHAKESGQELYKVGGAFVWNNVKKLTLYPKGPDKRKMRGRTRFLYSIDEIGWFLGTEGQVKIDADEIDHALARSMTTIRQAAMYKRLELGDYNSPMAMAFNISSPSHANDKIMRLVRAGQSDPTKKVFHLPTWLAHPNITRASLEPEFKRNPIAAERDYGANPPIADSPFIANVDAIKACFSEKSQSSLVALRYATGVDRGEKNYCYAEAQLFASDKNIPFVLSLDAGYTNNSFALVLSHWDNEIVHHDILLEVVPLEETYINFAKVFDHIITPLFKHFNIQLVVADRWNSIKVLHDCEAQFKCEVIQHSAAWKDFELYRTRINENRIVLPKPEKPIDTLFNSSEAYDEVVKGKPVLHAALQLMTVKEIGKRVEKGDGGLTDDLFRASVLGTTFLLNEDYPQLRVGGNMKIKSHRMYGNVKMNGDSAGAIGNGRATTRLGGVKTRANRG